MNEADHKIDAVVVTLDSERDCTKTVRALRRQVYYRLLLGSTRLLRV